MRGRADATENGTTTLSMNQKCAKLPAITKKWNRSWARSHLAGIASEDVYQGARRIEDSARQKRKELAVR